jgi:hypothetical protein
MGQPRVVRHGRGEVVLARLTLAIVLIIALGLAGCSGEDTSATESAESGTSESAGSETGGSESSEAMVITLPDGWAMNDVISAEEVGAIMGANLTYFPEANSAAQDGRPSAGYVQESVEGSKIYFAVDVDGGTEELEIIKGYAVEGSLEEVPGLGDEAYALEYEDGRIGVIVVEGDAFIRIDWPADVYGSDAAGLGEQLANLLMSKMYE